ncbi:MAG: hypothetical protein ACRC20_02980 [Segniliparus sp.]|uniref:hypothetical protein n=1 Tax=Segniliparus sp. TaxID=2804064 RepID=UPI003F40DE54
MTNPIPPFGHNIYPTAHDSTPTGQKKRNVRIALMLLPLLLVVIGIPFVWKLWKIGHADPPPPKQQDSQVLDVEPGAGVKLKFGDTAVYTSGDLTVEVKVTSFAKAATNPPKLAGQTGTCGSYWVASLTATYSIHNSEWRTDTFPSLRFSVIYDDLAPGARGHRVDGNRADLESSDDFLTTRNNAIAAHGKQGGAAPFTVVGNTYFPNCTPRGAEMAPSATDPIGVSLAVPGSDNAAAKWLR